MTEQVEHLLAHFFELQVEVHQDLGGHPFLLAQEAKQEVFGPHVVVVQIAGFLDGILDDLLGSRGLGQFAHRDHFRAGLNNLLDLVADLSKVDVQVPQDVGGDATSFLDQAEQDMFGSDVLVVEALGLLIGQLHHLASAIGEAFIHSSTPIRRSYPHGITPIQRAAPRTTEVIIGAGNGKSSGRQSAGRSISSPSRSRLAWEPPDYKKTDFPATLQAP